MSVSALTYVILAYRLASLEYNGQAVVTVRMIADLHGKPANDVHNIIARNKDRFVNGTDIYTVQSSALRQMGYNAVRDAKVFVIESVFGGMKKAVICNSDYPTAKDMQAAIARHFEERNTYYQENPKRAGNKIWDKQKFDFDKLAGGLFKKM